MKNKIDKDPMSAVQSTPLMQQYREIKSRYPGMILFFRLGDFYEMFGEDAVKASSILEVVLTKRQGIPMCGVPFHAVNSYLKKLVKAGEKVAVCEQLEEPGQGKGIVRRDVVRVITPGTILEENLLDARRNNYLAALYPDKNLSLFALAAVDISTGDFRVTEVKREVLKNELFRLSPGEVVVPESCAQDPFILTLSSGTGTTFSALEDWRFSPDEAQGKILSFFKLKSLKPFGLENRALAQGAAAGALAYLEKTQVNRLPPLSRIAYYSLDDYLLLDEAVVRNLELLEGSASRSREGSLLGVIDTTLTPMGSRLLRQWLLQPLLSVPAIVKRQQAVAFFVEEGLCRRALRDSLKDIPDLERILSRLASGAANPRELISLKNALLLLPELRQALTSSDSLLPLPESIAQAKERLVAPAEILTLIGTALADEPPLTLKEGGIIRQGFSAELDDLRRISREGKSVISEMEAAERKRTGIATLKIGYTSVFGYYLEVTKANLGLVPQEYIRKQTLANAERFITPELKAFEEKVLSADEKIVRLEETLFRDLRAKILLHTASLQTIASALAAADVYGALAETAVLRNFCKPQVDDSHDLDIKDGRHPVIEGRIKSGAFVPNDTHLNGDSDQIILLTGPNMAGKSTYLRQTALIVILAQTGSYVPAAQARVGIVDRIFTRIGAADNLAGGESTFMVEMHETAFILHQFTPRSLIILDEVGRGTSTYDGISIARAAVEYLSQNTRAAAHGPKVLFATHYFELTDLAEKYAGIRNFNVAVKEWQGDVVFLHKIVPGAADRSYGIHVAQLAGLPKEVIWRAQEILRSLEQKALFETPAPKTGQLDFLASPSPQILIELDSLDVNDLTPLEALKLLAEWKKKTGNS